jgi:photosystem II stability/assembly factor-like uncharacterized protein
MRRAARCFVLVSIGALVWIGRAVAGVNQWTPVGPYRHGGLVTALAIDPQVPRTVYAGTNFGLFRSTDAGGTWAAINDGFTSSTIFDVAIDPVTTSTVYAVVSYPGGVFKSIDSGRGWKLIRYLPPEGPYGVIAIDPVDPRTLYVANTFGLLKSVDGGENWSFVAETFGGLPVTDVVIDPSNPSTLYAASSQVYRSTDGGQHWVATGVADAYTVRIDPNAPSTLYALAPNSVFKSTDGGSEWALASGAFPVNPNDLAIDPGSSATLYLTAGTAGVLKSTDGGTNWQGVNSGLPDAQVRFVLPIAVAPDGSSALYAGNEGLEGGLFKSSDGGTNWTDASGDFTPVEVRAVAAVAASPAVYAATDAGVFRSLDRGVSWSALNGGLSNLDVREVVPDPQEPSTLYARTSTVLAKSVDGGLSWTDLPADSPNFSFDVLTLTPRAPSTLYAATGNGLLWKTTDGGQSWETTQPFPNPIRSIAVDPQDSSIVLAGTDGAIYRSSDAGASWSQTIAVLPTSAFMSIVFAPGSSGTIYASWSFSGAAPGGFDPPGGVYKSTDGGAVWQGIESGLGVTALAVDPQSPSTVYVATFRGQLLRSTDGGSTFASANVGLPLGANAASLAIYPALPTTVYAALGGPGVFRATFSTAPCSEDGTALCLNDGRFRVEVGWQRTPLGPTQVAAAVPVTSNSGYFWFTDPDSVQLMIKVLDGTSVNGFFWVFYGALTNLGYTITVTDTLTGESRSYVNEPGHIASQADTAAFPGPAAGLASQTDVFPGSVVAADPGAAAEACQPDTHTLCLSEGRFQVRAVWQSTPSGPAGAAQIVPLTADTGAFWFFDSANIELVVKVLDGRPVNGHFWVFYGALSNVEYTIIVTDTVTGSVRSYHNTRGTLGSVADTSAF